MFAKRSPVMEAMEVRQLLSVDNPVWTQGWTNFVQGDGAYYSSYYQWFQRDIHRVCMDVDPSACMQDYSWLGDDFELTTFKGQVVTKYVGIAPYVIDPAAQKKWSVEEFLAEHPHAFDRFPKDVLPSMDWFIVLTDAKTGEKTLEGADFHFDGTGGIYGYDGGTLDEGKSAGPMTNAKAAQSAKHKKRAHHHHKAPAKKQSESLFMNRRLAEVRG